MNMKSLVPAEAKRSIQPVPAKDQRGDDKMSRARAFIRALRRGCSKACSRIMLGLLLLVVTTASAEETVRMGFLVGTRRDMTLADVRASFDLWAQELATKFDVPVQVLYYDDIVEMQQALRRGEINGVSADAMSLARTFKEDDLAEGFSVAMRGGWNLILLTGKGSAIQGVNDLPGKRVALLAGDQTSSLYLERLCQRHYGRDCNKVFADIQHVPNNSQAVLRLFFGKADVALVYRYGLELSKELNPQLEKSIGSVIAELPLTSLYYTFFGAAVSTDLRRHTLRVVPTMHTYPRGRQLLDILKMDHLEPAQPSELKPFMQLEREYRELKAQAERQKGRK
jgi:ABC-type phosphate/phosphonate transport system substrate-binding protein